MSSRARCNQQAYGARRDLPNRVTTRKSRTQQTFAFNKSQILFESDTYIWNIIQLSKFIELLLLYFLSITPLCLWGSVGVINRLLWYIYLLT